MATSGNQMSSIGILTSGGDSQGMNCVIYGLIKCSIDNDKKSSIYLIRDGYKGLLIGDDRYIQMGTMDSIEINLHRGGTMIGSSRSIEFQSADGRRKAAYNLLQMNIHNLIIIGGDGSLTGANQLKQEWPDLARQWASEKADNRNLSKDAEMLNIIGIIGSIDNDFFGTEMTIGADSALNRIVESIDTLTTTAISHHRAMVIEVMGRNCGYLALSAALATEATYVFIPECPQPNADEWKTKLKCRIMFERDRNQFHHLVIVAEGACDQDGTPIRATMIRDYMDHDLSIDTRAICLGHVQRGGEVSAYDRLMSIRMGMEAFKIIQNNKREEQALVLTVDDGRIVAKSLVDCVQQTIKLGQLLRTKHWNEVFQMRGSHFIHTWNTFRELMSPNIDQSSFNTKFWLIANFGRPVPAMNAILYAIARYGYSRNVKVLASLNGIDGLMNGQLKSIHYEQVSNLVSHSGSIIGSKKISSTSLTREKILEMLKVIEQYQITGICLIGDRTGFELGKQFKEYSSSINLIYIPCLVESNDPLFSKQCKLGYDSILNTMMHQLTNLMMANHGSEMQLFLVKVDLTMVTTDFVEPTLVALACSAIHSYPPTGNKEIDRPKVENDAKCLKERMLTISNRNELIIVNDQHFNQIIDIYQTIFSIQPNISMTIIDMSQQTIPMKPSPFDRKLGVKLGMRGAQYMWQWNETNQNGNWIVLNVPMGQPVSFNEFNKLICMDANTV